MNSSDIYKILPLLVIAGTILFTLILEMFSSKSRYFIPWISIVVCFGTAFFSLCTANEEGVFFSGMLAAGKLVNIFYFLFNLGAALVMLISFDYMRKIETELGEYYILILSAVLGMMLIAGARDLVMVFIGLELMSLCFYILTGIRRRNSKSNESALKYFLLGSFATGFIVYGMGLIYGAVHSLSIDAISLNLSSVLHSPIFLVGMLLFIIGFTFKIAAFPFHMWVPDVYQGAPTGVTALMSTVGKMAAFAALLLLFIPIAVQGGQKLFSPFFAVLSVLSMVYGSTVALAQKDIKRMLAYSSIAHAGYMLIGLAAGNSMGAAGVVFYIGIYTFMNIGAFGVVSILETRSEKFLAIDDYKGLGFQQPLLAALLALFMFSLAGIPPFGGFFGKYYVFVSAIKAGYTWLALLGILASVISVYFYLHVVVVMYFMKSKEEILTSKGTMAMLGVLTAAIFVIVVGVAPGSIINLLSAFI
jgi:NADH-quinone oxidoreductase subunit N